MKRHDQTCSLWYCNRRLYALGFCMGHYQNLRRHGDVIAPSEYDQRTLRDMCDDLASASLQVIEHVLAGPCPACGSGAATYHKSGCAVENLLALAMRVRSSKSVRYEEKAALEPG